MYGWEAVDERNISEYSATGTLYRHRTGARMIKVQDDLEAKVDPAHSGCTHWPLQRPGS